MELLEQHGVGNWKAVAAELPGRTPKYISDRWKSFSDKKDVEALRKINRFFSYDLHMKFPCLK
jgi:Myb-like DNA-binding domain